MLEAATFLVRELAPAFAAGSLLPARVGPPWAPARWLAESGTKVPHSKALRASNIFRAESRKMRRICYRVSDRVPPDEAITLGSLKTDEIGSLLHRC